LILCPKTLAGNWKSELLTKFSIRAEIVNAEGLLSWINEVKANGDSTHFALIATYPGVRIGTQDLRRIEENEEPERDAGKCYKLLDSWSSSYPFADLAIFDEAHILRNRNSNFSKTASAFSRAVDGLVCVSATPVSAANTRS
jgi:SNF2 family DNA or RNA helicase